MGAWDVKEEREEEKEKKTKVREMAVEGEVKTL